MKTVSIPQVSIEELACHIVGLDYDEIDADTEVIEDELEVTFGIGVDLKVFGKIVSSLLPLIDIGEGIGKKRYKGFADQKHKMFFVKTEL